jgi:hypothetical protein
LWAQSELEEFFSNTGSLDLDAFASACWTRPARERALREALDPAYP